MGVCNKLEQIYNELHFDTLDGDDLLQFSVYY